MLLGSQVFKYNWMTKFQFSTYKSLTKDGTTAELGRQSVTAIMLVVHIIFCYQWILRSTKRFWIIITFSNLNHTFWDLVISANNWFRWIFNLKLDIFIKNYFKNIDSFLKNAVTEYYFWVISQNIVNTINTNGIINNWSNCFTPSLPPLDIT